MGAGASRPTASSSEPSLSPSVESLDQPWLVGGGQDKCFHAIPLDNDLLKRSSSVVLEVGPQGFRVLRPKLMAPLLMFPWGQIHSWSHATRNFSFRYFDDSKRAIQQINLCLRDVDPLLDFIQTVVDSILVDRKVNAISSEDYEAILRELRQAPGNTLVAATPLAVVARHAQERYFMADQGRAMMALLPSCFDKLELAVMLHSRLVDQSRFAVMLEELEDQADRDNVWLRITTAKAKTSLSQGGAMRSGLRTTSSAGGLGLQASSGSPRGGGGRAGHQQQSLVACGWCPLRGPRAPPSPPSHPGHTHPGMARPSRSPSRPRGDPGLYQVPLASRPRRTDRQRKAPQSPSRPGHTHRQCLSFTLKAPRTHTRTLQGPEVCRALSGTSRLAQVFLTPQT